jgi:glutamate synthase (NADPH/NADH) small chain
MGKITGFLEIEREDRPYAPVAERIKHYREFVEPLSEKETRDQAARCMDCGIPYCHNGCPVNNQIPDWNDLVYRGDWEEARAICTRPIIFRKSRAASARRRAKRPAR